MSESERDYELSVQALRAQAHPSVDKARVRERLVARGVLTSAAAAGAAASTTVKAASSWSAASALKLATALTVLTVVSVGVLRETRTPSRGSLEHVLDGPLHTRPAPEPLFVEHAAEKTTAPIAPAQRAVVPASRASVPKSTSIVADPQLDLARENALISAAVTALRAGEPARATSLLDQHEHEFPEGFLRAERETARKRVSEALRAGSKAP
jgi:hypothetical protein